MMDELVKPIRIADETDADDVMAVCREIHAENGLRGISETKVEAQMMQALRKEHGIIAVIGGPGAIEALFYAVPQEPWYSDEPFLSERFLFVRPNYRRTTHLRRLLDYAKGMAVQVNLPLLIGVVSSDRTEAKVRAFRRHLAPVGALFLHNARTGRA